MSCAIISRFALVPGTDDYAPIPCAEDAPFVVFPQWEDALLGTNAEYLCEAHRLTAAYVGGEIAEPADDEPVVGIELHDTVSDMIAKFGIGEIRELHVHRYEDGQRFATHRVTVAYDVTVASWEPKQHVMYIVNYYDHADTPVWKVGQFAINEIDCNWWGNPTDEYRYYGEVAEMHVEKVQH